MEGKKLNHLSRALPVFLLALALAVGCAKQEPAQQKQEPKQEAKKDEKKAEKKVDNGAVPQVADKAVEKTGEGAAAASVEEEADDTPAAAEAALSKKSAEAAPAAEEKKEERAKDSFRAPAEKRKAGPGTPMAAPEARMERARKLVSSKTSVGIMGADFGAADTAALGDSLAEGVGGIGKTGIVRDPDGIPAGPTKEVPGTEDYQRINENEFKKVVENPLSTFSIDVDTASYANVRRFINQSRMPPLDAVRIEELINYFKYEYAYPEGDVPFSVNTEISQCPWNKQNRLVLVGLQGKTAEPADLPASNLVFLIDASGSMNSPNKMGLLKQGFKMLVQALDENSRIAIVVYAGAAGLALKSTPASDQNAIIGALDQLRAGGSTAGGAGIQLAYKVAKDNFVKGGNNRVILATDGDFNVGASSNAELERMIEEKRKEGIFLSVLGFGMGNYKDSKMETLADKGNGNYAYIDNILEAKKVLVTDLTGTLFTIAKDVKLQIEFNPTKVKEYRLIGYENRVLAKEDFDDDTKDAGELGMGHTVTALYELVPQTGDAAGGEDLKYMKTEVKDGAKSSGELMTVNLRYKAPDADVSKKIEHPVMDDGMALDKTSGNFRWASAVAGFGMLARNSRYSGTLSGDAVLEMARGAKGDDRFGYRAEFIQLIEKAQLLGGLVNRAEAPKKADDDTGEVPAK